VTVPVPLVLITLTDARGIDWVISNTFPFTCTWQTAITEMAMNPVNSIMNRACNQLKLGGDITAR
jgi:hypothetical protein